tara:strand:+ start:290 stop:481 length:192 start_codon:yes stop_codon:yes gene_type:complete
MNKEKLMDELNDLIECILCPSDLIESIDEYVRLKKIEELKIIEKNLYEKKVNVISDRIKELKQ